MSNSFFCIGLFLPRRQEKRTQVHKELVSFLQTTGKGFKQRPSILTYWNALTHFRIKSHHLGNLFLNKCWSQITVQHPSKGISPSSLFLCQLWSTCNEMWTCSGFWLFSCILLVCCKQCSMTEASKSCWWWEHSTVYSFSHKFSTIPVNSLALTWADHSPSSLLEKK